MNILILAGLATNSGGNANLISKVFMPLLENHQLLVLSSQSCQIYYRTDSTSVLKSSSLPFEKKGHPIAQLFTAFFSKIIDANGYSDYISERRMICSIKKIISDYHIQAVLSTMEPFSAADAAAKSRIARKILFLIDPPANVIGASSSNYRNRRLKRIFRKQDVILTTPFIYKALINTGFGKWADKLIPVGFPMIAHNYLSRMQEDNSYIRLLFCGWLYSDIRSPKYFLDIVSRLDERFEVTFMGKECELLQERFPIQTKAKIVTLPNQPYEIALQAMADADIMINIGNSVPVHMPSKTLEYINTGKPFVNFHKMDDCPTLYYTKRYPLCLNLSENDPDVDSAAERFIDFCIANKGKTVDREYIEREYEDCTPEYIAQKILDALGE